MSFNVSALTDCLQRVMRSLWDAPTFSLVLSPFVVVPYKTIRCSLAKNLLKLYCESLAACASEMATCGWHSGGELWSEGGQV